MPKKPDFEALFDASPYPYLLIDTALTIIGANHSYLRATGRRGQDITGRYLFDAFPPNPADPDSTNAADIRASIEQAVATRQPHSVPLVRYAIAHTAQGGSGFEPRYWSAVHTPVFDASGTLAFIAQTAIDVSDLYRLDEKSQLGMVGEDLHSERESAPLNRAQMHIAMTRILKDERSHLSTLLNRSPGFIAVMTGKNLVFEMVNDAYYQLVGQRKLIGRPLWEALPEVAGQGFEEQLGTVFDTGVPFVGRDLPVRLQPESGGATVERYVDLLFQPLFGPDGAVSGILAQGHDVTETHQAQLARQEADERLQDGMLIGRMVVWDWHLESGSLTTSANAHHMVGADWTNIHQAWKAIHPEDREQLLTVQQRTLLETNELHQVIRVIRPDNHETVWLDNRIKVKRDASGQAVALRGVSLDITGRTRSEAELARVNVALAEQVKQLEGARSRQAFRLHWADLLRTLSDASEILKQSSRLLGNYLNASRVLCGEYDIDKQLVTFHSNYTDGSVGEIDGVHAAAQFGLDNFNALNGGKTWVCDDLRQDPRTSGPEVGPAFEALHIRAAVILPLNRNGSLITFLFINEPQPRHWTGDEIRLLEDIAERTWNAVERARAEQALRDADHRKDQFLAMLAHELRNPLAPISAAAQLLKAPAPDPERIRRTSDVITRQVSHLTALVDDLLDVSRATSGLVVLNRQKVNIEQVVSDAVEQVRPLVAARRHRLDVRMAPGFAHLAHVDGDHKRLVQVLANLVNNAAKYTPEGGVIEVHTEVLDRHIVLRVRDNGIGISRELLPNVFQLFTQEKRSPDRSQGGLGLGLALVKSLVELHGGTVEAHSKGERAGSEFIIRLDRLQELRGPAPEGEPGRVAPLAAPTTLRLMVVDDNVDAAAMLAMFLESSGHEVLVANDSRSALERAGREQVDAYLLDIGLPEMDGNELARRLRKLPASKRPVLVAITGYGQQFERETSMEAGFDHYFVKPADPVALLQVLAGQK
jgi:signal transduction histidine kinase